MRNLMARLIPFFMLGIALVALFFGLVLLAYLFVFGALVGIVLFLINWVKVKFFPANTIVKREAHKQGSGNLIDHDEQK